MDNQTPRLGYRTRYPPMRIRYTISFLLVATFAAAVTALVYTPPRPGVEMFLVDYDFLETFDAPYLTDIPLDLLELPESAMLEDAEILEYDWANHRMVLTASGTDKLPRRGEFSVASQYFILAVNREPCYVGSIETHMSSNGHKCPTILIDDLPARGGSAPIEITIDACYPHAVFTIPTDQDMRFDQRLKSWLDATTRLKNGG
jgi:hypothetical protein